jgi:hypothetical protein
MSIHIEAAGLDAMETIVEERRAMFFGMGRRDAAALGAMNRSASRLRTKCGCCCEYAVESDGSGRCSSPAALWHYNAPLCARGQTARTAGYHSFVPQSCCWQAGIPFRLN